MGFPPPPQFFLANISLGVIWLSKLFPHGIHIVKQNNDDVTHEMKDPKHKFPGLYHLIGTRYNRLYTPLGTRIIEYCVPAVILVQQIWRTSRRLPSGSVWKKSICRIIFIFFPPTCCQVYGKVLAIKKIHMSNYFYFYFPSSDISCWGKKSVNQEIK